MMEPHPTYVDDFNDALDGLREDLSKHQESIYREIESNVITAWKEVQRIQGEIITEVAKRIPSAI